MYVYIQTVCPETLIALCHDTFHSFSDSLNFFTVYTFNEKLCTCSNFLLCMFISLFAHLSICKSELENVCPNGNSIYMR